MILKIKIIIKSQKSWFRHLKAVGENTKPQENSDQVKKLWGKENIF